MASPFRLFRKYQKTLLVVAGVVLMFVFVIGDALVGYMGGGPGVGAGRDGTLAPNAVAVSWDGGRLTNQELDNMIFQRRLVNAFVREVEGRGRLAAVEAGVEPRRLRVEPIVGAETPEQGVENDIVTTKLFADLAKKAGMRISDEAIVRYLVELGRQHVTREDMRAIIQRMQVGGNRLSIDYLLDALRQEMLARNYLASYHFSLATVTPEERWRDWLRVNDRVALEAVPYPAEKYLVDVREPTDADLAAFFNERDDRGTAYSDREPQPDFKNNTELPSRHPGFAAPRKIDVRFIKADYDKFLTKVENEITDEEIAKYYEENKDPLFIKADTLLIDEGPTSEASGGTDASTTESGEAATDATGGTAGEGEPGGTPAGESQTNGQAPVGQTPAEAGDTQPPAETEGGAESEATAPTEGDQSSALPDRAQPKFRLTAFLQETDSTAPADAGKAAAESSAAGETPPAASDATSTPDPSTEVSPDTAPPSETPTAAESVPATTPPAPAKPKEFQPLDEVRDEIRRQLAGDRVTQQLIDLMAKLNGELDEEFNKYFATVLEAEVDQEGDAKSDKNQTPPPPPPPTGALADLAGLAEKNGLEYGTTGPLSFLEMRDAPVGKSFDAEMQVALCQMLFGGQDLEMYQPVSTFDLEGNRYLSMKTSDTAGREPKLGEIRDQVVKAWKLREAAKVAQKYAEEDAKKAQAGGTPLTEYFADDPSVTVIRTDPFSWLTGGEVSRLTGQQQPFRLSEPDGIVAAGPDFMEEVFELGDGQVGSALNNDHSIAYVVRVADHQLTPEELRTAFLAEASTWPGLFSMMRAHSQDAARALLADIRQDVNLEWDRPADQIEQDE